jgi:putative hemolysin
MTVITRVNQLELRLVNDGPEIEAAQALRYQVFYGEMGAHASAEMRACGRDFDRYDAIADHLVVVDLDRSSGFRPWVAGCYRVLRGPVAARHGGFYTASEFDLSGVAVPRDEVMELGRSCVHAEYRGGPAMQLLWRGIAGYVETYGVGLMLGCASLPGTDADALAAVLSYLHHHHLAPPEIRPRALPGRFVATDRLPPDQVDVSQVQHDLPPLVKGYLWLGGMIGEGAAVDEQFNSTDVCLVLPTAVAKARAQRLFRPLRPALAAEAA